MPHHRKDSDASAPVLGIDHESGRTEYRAATTASGRREVHGQENKHYGQVKLLLSEIDFLTDYAQEGDSVVYAGAADGMHIPALARMFASLKLKWYLFDSTAFNYQVYDWRNNDGVGKCFMHHRYFKDDDAKAFGKISERENNILFISDIRSNGRVDGSNMPSDEEVLLNQQLQSNWVLLMQPRACMLKFRGAYEYRRYPKYAEFPYLDGQLRLQAWPRPNSTELRLVCTKPYSEKQYSSQMLEETMAFYNRSQREQQKNDRRLQNFIVEKYKDRQADEECKTHFDILFKTFIVKYVQATIARNKQDEAYKDLQLE